MTKAAYIHVFSHFRFSKKEGLKALESCAYRPTCSDQCQNAGGDVRVGSANKSMIAYFYVLGRRENIQHSLGDFKVLVKIGSI